MQLTFRPYQEDAKNEVVDNVKYYSRVAYVSAAGSGKTRVALGVAKDLGIPTESITHRQDLCMQINEAAESAGLWKLVKVSMVQSQVNLPSLGHKLLIVDECHHYVFSWRNTIEKMLGPKTKLLGLTATPKRRDQIDVTRYFQAVVNGPDEDWLEKEGYLANVTIITPDWIPKEYREPIEPVLKHVKGVLVGKYYELEHMGDITEIWQRFVHNRPTIVFVSSIADTLEVVHKLASIGVRSAAMHHKIRNRESRIERFKNGQLQALVAVDILNEGVDLFLAKVGIILRKSQADSYGLWKQMVGRIKRQYKGQTGLIIDAAGNACNFGYNPKPGDEWYISVE